MRNLIVINGRQDIHIVLECVKGMYAGKLLSWQHKYEQYFTEALKSVFITENDGILVLITNTIFTESNAYYDVIGLIDVLYN